MDLVCGFAANCFQEVRHWSMEDLKVACAAAGTLPLTHASYFFRKSSHSATPMSPAAGVVLAGVAVVAGVVAGVAAAFVFELAVALAWAVLVFSRAAAGKHDRGTARRRARRGRSVWLSSVRFFSLGKSRAFRVGPSRDNCREVFV